MTEIWAKSASRSKDGTQPVRLADHTSHVLDAFEYLKNEIPERILSPQLRELIRLAIICHDFGKVLPAFQIRRLGNRHYTPSDVLHDVDHSLVSVLWIDDEKLREEVRRLCPGDNDFERYKRFVISAVAYHHWRERFHVLLRPDSREFQQLAEKFLTDRPFTESLQHNLQEEMKTVHGLDGLLSFNEKMAEGLKNGVPFIEYATPPYELYWLPKRIAESEEKIKDWILLSGFLMRCDHYASYCEKEEEALKNIAIPGVTCDAIIDQVVVEIREGAKEDISEEDIWQIKEVSNNKDENTILIAPTGYGKTEFAFLWSNGHKFFYTLPIRSAVNQTYLRAQKIFNHSEESQTVGILHGDADVFLLDDGGESQDNMKSYDLARQLSFPAIISTGDQFFPYALRPPGYEKIYAAFPHSRLIIDEVQAYDPRAAAIVVKFALDVVRMGGKFLLMTATLPTFVRKAIVDGLKELGEDHHLPAEVDMYSAEKEKFTAVQKHKIQVKLIENSTSNGQNDFSLPEEVLDTVLAEARKGQRVLVILNTVRQAVDVYGKLMERASKHGNDGLSQRMWLLHSRFTLEERSERERKICGDKKSDKKGEFGNPKPDDEKVGKILVATQVIEASLDLDADVLFTEIAPLDSLVQRMGRVLRRIREPYCHNGQPNVHVWVFKNGLQSGSHRVYEPSLVLYAMKLLRDKADNRMQSGYINWIRERFMNQRSKSDQADIVSEIFSKNAEGSLKPAKGAGKRKTKSPEPAENVAPAAVFELALTEFDKYELVEKGYELPEEHPYLRKFRQTLDILDAGYMSDRKEEAQEMFREIFNINVIPLSEKGKFLAAVKDFLKNIEGLKRPFVHFKRQVLQKFVVQAPRPRWVDIHKYRLENHLQEVEEIDPTLLKRLKTWCRNIYLLDYDYDSKKGLMYDPSRIRDDSAFV